MFLLAAAGYVAAQAPNPTAPPLRTTQDVVVTATVAPTEAARVARTVTTLSRGANVLDREYHEVTGVAIPGRWLTFGVTLK